jgi:hypothetical protein
MWGEGAHPRLEPVVELDNVRMLHALQHFQLIVHHLLVSSHVLLQDDLDGDLALGAVGLPDDAICTGAQCLSKAVAGSTFDVFSIVFVTCGGY